MNHIKHIAVLVLLGLGAMALLGFAVDRQHDRACEMLDVEFIGNLDLDFVNAQEVEQRIHDRGDVIVGQAMSTIHTEQIENDLMNMPHIRSANVYKTIDLKLKVVVEQRDPVLRFNSNSGVSGHIDSDGYFMPLRAGYSPKLIPVTGELPITHDVFTGTNVKEDAFLNQLWSMMNFIKADEFWKSQIVQIDFDMKGEVTAIPRVGNHKILLGTTADFEKKFSRLKAFYDKGAEQTNWNIYESIDVKYEDQVVCKKR